MKKFILALTVVFGLISLTSCFGHSGNKADKTERPAEVSII